MIPGFYEAIKKSKVEMQGSRFFGAAAGEIPPLYRGPFHDGPARLAGLSYREDRSVNGSAKQALNGPRLVLKDRGQSVY